MIYEYKDEAKVIKKENAMNFDLPKYLKMVCIDGWKLNTMQRGVTTKGDSVYYLLYERKIK